MCISSARPERSATNSGWSSRGTARRGSSNTNRSCPRPPGSRWSRRSSPSTGPSWATKETSTTSSTRSVRTSSRSGTIRCTARNGSSRSAASAASRYDMASAAIGELRKQGEGFTVERYTVPGIKDLAAGARILFDRGCDLVMALGMVGRQPVDKDCALAAEFGLQAVQAQIGKHILGVMVHEEEASDEAELAGLFDRRT